MAIRFQGFAGEIPRQEPFYLPETAAVTAQNLNATRGSLRPIRGKSEAKITFPTNRASIYLHGVEWLAWNHQVSAVPGPVAEDRLYITHSNAAPTMRISGEEVPLRLPKPTVRPTVTRTGTLDTDNAEVVAYAYTWVTSLGEESGPSPLSTSIKMSEGNTITVGGMPGAVPVANRFITAKRIYQAQTGASGATDLFFVAEVPATDVSFVHDLDTHPLAEAITTKEFDPAPSNLRGLTAMPNGIMAGYRGKELCFCEPYQPHAWPGSYALTTNDTIIGLAAFGTSLAVLTTGMPYVVQGLHPDQMVMEKIEQPFPCMANAGIVDMGYAAIYPSTDGLVSVSQQGAQLVSAGVWTREQWLEMQPTTFRAARLGSLYVFTYVPAAGGARQMVLFDPANPQGGIVRVSEPAVALYTHLESGILYLLESDARTIKAFDDPAAEKRSYVWRSKPYREAVPQSYGAMRIETEGAAGDAVMTRVFGDGALIHTTSAMDRDARLPAGAYRTWQIELTGNATVLRVSIGRTLAELG